MKFKDKLKQIRIARGLSQQALADAIHISRSAIAKWENGLGYPNPDALESLISYFGTDTHFFDSVQTEADISFGAETTPTRAGGIFCKWFTIVAGTAILLFGCFCLLTQWKCITLPMDGISVKEIYMFPDGRLIYRLENVPNDVWCSTWDFINTEDGSIYKIPKRSVIELYRNSQPNQMEVEILIDPNEENAYNTKLGLPHITKWYLGEPGNAIFFRAKRHECGGISGSIRAGLQDGCQYCSAVQRRSGADSADAVCIGAGIVPIIEDSLSRYGDSLNVRGI